MQTITLEFKKLDRLPVPESTKERLLTLTDQESMFITIVNVEDKTNRLFFDTAINPDWTYAHVKVTSTETDFKVGDRVKWKGYNGEIVASLRESDGLLFEYKTPEFVMGFNGLKTNQVVVHPKELTIITQ